MNNDCEEKADPKEDSTAASKVIERNIRTLTDLRHKADDDRSLQSRASDTITAFSGHMIFVYVYMHVVWRLNFVQQWALRDAAFRPVTLSTFDHDRVAGSDLPIDLCAD